MGTQICDTLAETDEPMSVSAIVRATGADYEAVKQKLFFENSLPHEGEKDGANLPN